MTEGITVGRNRPAHLVLVNETAGRGRAPRLLSTLRRSGSVLSAAEIVSVTSPADVRAALARRGSDQIPVVAGGDGTVSMVATELLREGPSAIPLGILPIGTGNLVANALGIFSVEAALEVLRQPQVRRLDVMRTSSPAAPVALVSMSTGFEGGFMGRYADRRHRGRAGAALAAGIPLARRQHSGILVEADGTPFVRPDEAVFSAGIYNTRCYAGGIAMYPAADPADGFLELVVYLTALDYWRSMAAAIAGRTGRPRDVLRSQCRQAIIRSTGPLQIDGESVTPGELNVRIDPLALRLLAPRR